MREAHPEQEKLLAHHCVSGHAPPHGSANPQLLYCQTSERVSQCSWRDAINSATPVLHDINEASERALMHSGTRGQDVYFYTDISTAGVRGAVLKYSSS